VSCVVRELALLEACVNGDRCKDANAVCSEGQCLCRPGYFDLAGRCGQFAVGSILTTAPDYDFEADLDGVASPLPHLGRHSRSC